MIIHISHPLNIVSIHTYNHLKYNYFNLHEKNHDFIMACKTNFVYSDELPVTILLYYLLIKNYQENYLPGCKVSHSKTKLINMPVIPLLSYPELPRQHDRAAPKILI